MSDGGETVLSPEAPADLTRWHELLRVALRQLQLNNDIGYGHFKKNGWPVAVYAAIMFRAAWSVKLSFVAVLLGATFLLGTWYRRRVRRLVARQDLVRRLLDRDPALIVPGDRRRGVDILAMETQDQVTGGLKHLCNYLGYYIAPRPRWAPWLNAVLILVVLALLLFVYLNASLISSYSGAVQAGDLSLIEMVLAALFLIILVLQSSVRRVEHFLAVCLPLADALNVDVAGEPGELARGMPALAGKLKDYARGLHQFLGAVLAVLGLLAVIGSIVAIASSVPGAFASLVCHGVVAMVLIWEYLDENLEFRVALDRSGIALKLFNGEFIPAMFSPASRTKAALLLPLAGEAELARLAALLAVEYREYINYRPSKLRRYSGFVVGGIVLSVAAVYLLSTGATREVNEVMAFALVLSALLLYLGMSSLISAVRRLVELLNYLHDEIEEQR